MSYHAVIDTRNVDVTVERCRSPNTRLECRDERPVDRVLDEVEPTPPSHPDPISSDLGRTREERPVQHGGEAGR